MQSDENRARRMTGKVYRHCRTEGNAEAEEKFLFPALPEEQLRDMSLILHRFPSACAVSLNSEKGPAWKREGTAASS